VADDAVRLPIDFGNSAQDAQSVRARLAELQAEVRDLQSSYDQGMVASGRYREEMQRIGAESRKLAVSLDAVDDASRAATHGRGARGGNGMQGFGMAMLQASRGIQDFQAAGIMGMVNNIEGLSMALGLGAGLSGVATLAFVALQVLLPMFRNMGDDAAEATDEIEKLNAQIKEMEKKPIKLEADYEAIAQAKSEVEMLTKAKDALDKLMGKQSQDEAASGKAVGDLLASPENRAVLERLKTDAASRAIAEDPAVKAANEATAAEMLHLQRMRAEVATTQDDARRRSLDAQISASVKLTLPKLESVAEGRRQAISEAAINEVNKLVYQAQSGVGSEQAGAQVNLADRLRGVGPAGGDMARRLGLASPAAKRTARLVGEEFDAMEAEDANAEIGRKQARKARKQESDAAFDAMTAEVDADIAAKKLAQDEGKRSADARRRQVEGLAGEVGPALMPEIAGMLDRSGGQTNPASRAAMERAIAGRIAGAPGVGQENALAVAAEVLKRSIEAYQQRMWEQQQQMLQMMQGMAGQFGGMAGRQWTGQRLRPMAPTNLWRRPF
jgi:hypothetical protein